jgi:hypothetical protein
MELDGLASRYHAVVLLAALRWRCAPNGLSRPGGSTVPSTRCSMTRTGSLLERSAHGESCAHHIVFQVGYVGIHVFVERQSVSELRLGRIRGLFNIPTARLQNAPLMATLIFPLVSGTLKICGGTSVTAACETTALRVRLVLAFGTEARMPRMDTGPRRHDGRRPAAAIVTCSVIYSAVRACRHR